MEIEVLKTIKVKPETYWKLVNLKTTRRIGTMDLLLNQLIDNENKPIQ